MMDRFEAILIIGPTGSGKTPLGDLIERKGLWDRRCFHFDFGLNLRNIGAQDVQPPGFSKNDFNLIQKSLKTGKLLENKDFHIARKIYRVFRNSRHIDMDDLVILNGLPRHMGQADDVGGILNIILAVYLECPLAVAYERIRLNTGGDRFDRADDADEAVKNRSSIFKEQTLPLLEYYRKKGIWVKSIEIDVKTDPKDILFKINRLKPERGSMSYGM
jgi:adenylate kinase